MNRREFIATCCSLGAARAASIRDASRTGPWVLGMPGLYPARVIGIEHKHSLVGDLHYPPVIQAMFRAGMELLTGAPDWRDAWRLFFEPGDVVGIKVNPVSYPYLISSGAVLWEIIAGLEAAGIQRGDIVVYDRYRQEFLAAGMAAWAPPGVRTMFAAEQWDAIQQSIDGYDPDHFMELPYGMPGQDTSQPSVRRSYAALFITKTINKLINLSLLKDHQAAGVTLSLKNLSHGLVNNVNRSHPDTTQNYTGTFIPASVSIPVIRDKAVLHILDGIRGLYHSGPHARPQFLWDHHTMYFATDPVALDRIGWKVIDEKRIFAGMKPVAEAPPDEFSTWFSRQPEHIVIAGQLGLGEWQLDRINYRHVRLDDVRSYRPGRDLDPVPSVSKVR